MDFLGFAPLYFAWCGFHLHRSKHNLIPSRLKGEVQYHAIPGTLMAASWNLVLSVYQKNKKVLWFNLNVVLKCYDQRNGVRQRLNGDLINNLVLLFSAGVCFLHLYWLSNWFGHSFVQSRKHEEHDKCYLLKINKCKSKMFNWKRKHGDVIKERWESFHVTISFITQYWCCCNVCSWAVLLWT